MVIEVNKMMKQFVFGLVVLASISGCQNPYDKTDGNLLAEKPAEPRAVLPAYTLDVPEVMEFNEGIEAAYTVVAKVPQSEGAEVTVYGLPTGAVYDSKTSRIAWTPSFDSANDPKNSAVVVRSYPIKAVLKSTSNKLTTVEKNAVLIVKDTPRKLEITSTSAEYSVKEGQELKQDITIRSEDFPAGPFYFKTQNLPAGAVVQSDMTNPAHFILKFTPDYKTAAYGSNKQFDVTAIVSTPRNQEAAVKSVWTVNDNRQYPAVSAPTSISQGLTVYFTMSAEDLNGEIVPKIDLSQPTKVGTVTFDQITVTPVPGGNPVTTVGVKWSGIPQDRMGTKDNLFLRACVYNDAGYKNHCKQHTVQVTFPGSLRLAPVVDRAAWPLGTVQFIREKQESSFSLPVSDPDSSEIAPRVAIDPPEMASEVKWESGRVSISSQSAGIKQFSIIVTSDAGLSRAESFIYEALPSSWSSVLIFGDSLKDQEVAGTLKLIPGAQVVNPVLQELDAKMLALRSTWIVGTSAIEDIDIAAIVEKKSAQVRNIIVQTPLVGLLGSKLLNEMTDAGVSVSGRLGDRPQEHPTVASVILKINNKDEISLATPKSPIKLSGRLSTESRRPALLALAESSKCKTLFSFTRAENAWSAPAVVKCQRKTGGNLILGGIEWADISSDPVTDPTIVSNWLKELVK